MISHLILDPLGEVRDFGVDTESVFPSTAVSPADHSYQGHGSVLTGISRHQRSPAVSLTGVLPALLQTGAEHVVGHLTVHGATVSVREDSDPDLVEVGGEVAAGGHSSPARD